MYYSLNNNFNSYKRLRKRPINGCFYFGLVVKYYYRIKITKGNNIMSVHAKDWNIKREIGQVKNHPATQRKLGRILTDLGRPNTYIEQVKLRGELNDNIRQSRSTALTNWFNPKYSEVYPNKTPEGASFVKYSVPEIANFYNSGRYGGAAQIKRTRHAMEQLLKGKVSKTNLLKEAKRELNDPKNPLEQSTYDMLVDTINSSYKNFKSGYRRVKGVIELSNTDEWYEENKEQLRQLSAMRKRLYNSDGKVRLSTLNKYMRLEQDLGVDWDRAHTAEINKVIDDMEKAGVKMASPDTRDLFEPFSERSAQREADWVIEAGMAMPVEIDLAPTKAAKDKLIKDWIDEKKAAGYSPAMIKRERMKNNNWKDDYDNEF